MARRNFWVVFGLSCVFTGALPLAYGLRYGVTAPVFLFAGDAFYYFNLARHSAGFHGFTFDGQFATNGFHPLWEYLLFWAGRVGWIDYRQTVSSIVRAFYLDLSLLTVGAGLFAAAMTRFVRRPMLALLVVAPGLLWVVCGLVNGDYAATWSYLNGMESALTLLCFGAAIAILGPFERDEITMARTAVGSVLLGLAVLSRLDDVFLAAPVLVLLAVRRPRWAWLSVGPTTALLLVYLTYNWVSLHVLLPVSGAAKASFALPLNLKWTLGLFLPVVTGDGPRVAGERTWFYGFGERVARLMQMWLPALIAGTYLVTERGLERWKRWSMLRALSLGVILKALYNLCFVQVWSQGQWYYTVSIAVGNVILVVWLDRTIERTGWQPTRRGRMGLVLAQVLWVLFAFNVFISRRNLDGPMEEVETLRDGNALRSKLETLGADRFIEIDDGFTSYVANRPALAGLGLALDPEGVRALKDGRLLALAYARGYRVLVAHSAYSALMDDEIAQARRAGHMGQGGTGREAVRLTEVGGDGSGDLMHFYVLTRSAE